MKRFALFPLLLLVPVARAEDAPGPAAPEAPAKRLLALRLETGQRLSVSTSVSYEMKTTERTGEKQTESTESVQRTEKFLDLVRSAGDAGELEVERTFLTLYTKVRNGADERPTVFRSPLSGRSVVITEQNRRRDVALQGRGSLDALTQRTAGVDIDWRDVLHDRPVGPGDAWEPDSSALGRRVASYFNCGTSRSAMRVRYEADEKHMDRACAHLYVEWEMEGMRDSHLFAKTSLAGDAWFDLELGRFIDIDLVGTVEVQGATVLKGGARIVRGEGPASFKSVVKPADLEAAVEKDAE